MTYDKTSSILDLSDADEYPPQQLTGHRVISIILWETVLVAIVGLLVLGIAWEAGFFTAGLIAAIIIWVGVSPVIEIATVRKCRQSYK